MPVPSQDGPGQLQFFWVDILNIVFVVIIILSQIIKMLSIIKYYKMNIVCYELVLHCNTGELEKLWAMLIKSIPPTPPKITTSTERVLAIKSINEILILFTLVGSLSHQCHVHVTFFEVFKVELMPSVVSWLLANNRNFE